MAMIRFEVPEEAMAPIAATSEAFACAMRLAAAMFWYGRGDATMSVAAAIAGVSQPQFMRALKQAEQPTTDESLDSLDAELAYLAQHRPPDRAGG
jgi:hypothetical protein